MNSPFSSLWRAGSTHATMIPTEGLSRPNTHSACPARVAREKKEKEDMMSPPRLWAAMAVGTSLRGGWDAPGANRGGQAKAGLASGSLGAIRSAALLGWVVGSSLERRPNGSWSGRGMPARRSILLLIGEGGQFSGTGVACVLVFSLGERIRCPPIFACFLGRVLSCFGGLVGFCHVAVFSPTFSQLAP